MLKKPSFHLSTLLTCYLLGGCASTVPSGPGMTVHFSNSKFGKLVDIEFSVTKTGAAFSNPGGLSPSTNPMHEGKTMGAAPDSRGLPEWIDFTWLEFPYPSISSEPKDYNSWPRKTGRVQVKDRVPPDVINEIVQSNKYTPKNQLPDQSLWIYLIWTDTGIKMRWRQESGCCKVLRSGGDQID